MLAGIVIGLLASLWLIRYTQPTEDYSAALADLDEQRREDYIVLVSALYALDGDLTRAEERLASPERGVLYQVEELKQDPHREMHTRGG